MIGYFHTAFNVKLYAYKAAFIHPRATFIYCKATFICCKTTFIHRKEALICLKVAFICCEVTFIHRKAAFICLKVAFLSCKVIFTPYKAKKGEKSCLSNLLKRRYFAGNINTNKKGNENSFPQKITSIQTNLCAP